MSDFIKRFDAFYYCRIPLHRLVAIFQPLGDVVAVYDRRIVIRIHRNLRLKVTGEELGIQPVSYLHRRHYFREFDMIQPINFSVRNDLWSQHFDLFPHMAVYLHTGTDDSFFSWVQRDHGINPPIHFTKEEVESWLLSVCGAFVKRVVTGGISYDESMETHPARDTSSSCLAQVLFCLPSSNSPWKNHAQSAGDFISQLRELMISQTTWTSTQSFLTECLGVYLARDVVCIIQCYVQESYPTTIPGILQPDALCKLPGNSTWARWHGTYYSQSKKQASLVETPFIHYLPEKGFTLTNVKKKLPVVQCFYEDEMGFYEEEMGWICVSR